MKATSNKNVIKIPGQGKKNRCKHKYKYKYTIFGIDLYKCVKCGRERKQLSKIR